MDDKADICRHQDDCPFFNGQMEALPPIYSFLKKTICIENPLICARQILITTHGITSLPEDLMPHETHKLKLYN